MPVNDLVRVPDFNDIQTIIASVMGVGSGTNGYGQTLLSSQASAGDSVSKSQFDNLRYDIVNALVHQSGTVPTIHIPAVGELLRYGANLPVFQYQTLASLANTNRFDIAFGQYSTANKATNSNSVSFAVQAQATVTVTFATSNDARHFFNSGGKIRFISSFEDTLGEAQSQAWFTILDTLGMVSFGGNTPSVNFYTLTNTDQIFYEQGVSGTYSMNRWRLQAKCNVANNSTGSANVLTFTSTWRDVYNDPGGGPPPGDLVEGTMSLTVSELRAVGALYPNLVPNSFNAPTFSAVVSSISSS